MKGIHQENEPLFVLPDSHPARKALIAHLLAAESCVGREIPWPGMVEAPIEQKWFSHIDQRNWTFSAFAYCFISFDLILEGWLAESKEITPFESSFLSELPRLRELLCECEQAAQAANNARIAPLIAVARDFFSAFEESIHARVGDSMTTELNVPRHTLWVEGKPTSRKLQ